MNKANDLAVVHMIPGCNLHGEVFIQMVGSTSRQEDFVLTWSNLPQPWCVYQLGIKDARINPMFFEHLNDAANNLYERAR